MSTIRKHYGNWQCLVRVKDYPQIIKSFKLKEDANRWGNETELKIRREDAGIAKIKYPTFNDIGLRFTNNVIKLSYYELFKIFNSKSYQKI